MSTGTNSAGSVARNAIYGVSTWLLPLGISFVATPIIVKALGHNGYGIYALVLGFVGYSFNLNTGRAVTKYVAEFSASGETDQIRGVVSTTLILNLIVGAAGAAVIALAAPWLVTRLFRVDEQFAPTAVQGFHIAAAIIFLTMLSQVFTAAIQGYQRYDQFSKLTNLSNITNIAGNLALAFSGFGLVALLVWNAGVIGTFAMLSYLVARRLLPEGAITLRPRAGTLRTILSFSGGVIGYQIVSNLTLLFERGWILRELGEEQLTFYVVPMTLGIYIHALVASFLLVIFPLSSEIGADRAKLLRMYLISTKVVLFIVAFGALLLVLESRLFLTLWMGAELAASSAPVLVVHALSFMVAGLLVVTWNMVEGLGRPTYNFMVYSACFAVAVGGMILFTREYGIIGAALSRFAGFALLLFSVMYVERWVFGKIQYRFWLRSLAMIAAAIAGAVAVLKGSELILDGWSLMIAGAAGAGIVYVGILYAVGFIGAEEIGILRKLVGRKQTA